MILPYLNYIIEAVFALAVFGVALWAVTDGKGAGWLLMTIYGGVQLASAALGFLIMRRMFSGHHAASEIGVWSAAHSLFGYGGAILFIVALIQLARATPRRQPH